MRIDIEKGTVLLINKPYQWTSFDVVKKIRNILQKKLNRKIKVGHTGTLDPLATGLLLVCVGKATKDIAALTNLDKEYTGTMFIGATTPSYDLETSVDRTYPAGHVTPGLLHQTAGAFLGEIKQTPPIFSAVKVGGKPAYKKARKGRPVEIASRNVKIEVFDITDVQMPLVKFRIRCSKGTYIRSLVHDFGKALGSGAYLHELCRTRIGAFSLENAIGLKELLEHVDKPKG